MAQIDYLVSIHMNQNQLLFPVIQNETTAPTSPTAVEGQMYANTTSNTLHYFDGTSWIDLSVSTVADADYGDITVTGGVWSIDAGVVSFTEMQNIATDRFLGRITAATGVVEELTTAQATSMLDLFATGSTVQGLVPGSNGGGSSVFLDGTGAWSSPGGGFADFDAGGDTNINQTVNSGDVLDIIGGTGITTTITKATTIVTVSAALDNTAVTPSSYGSAGNVATFTVDQQGRLTSAASVSIDITESQINNLGTIVTLNADTDVSGNSWVIDEDNMTSNLDTKVPTQQSVKAYVDAAVTGALSHKGGYNASTNTPALDTGSPVLTIGDMYTVTVAGTFFTVELEVGDVLISDVDSVDAASIADWTIVQTNLEYATTTVAGFVILATQAQVNTGTNALNVLTADTLEDKTYGTFTGTTITDNSVLKVALQELETALEAVESTAATNASETVKGVVEEATDAETAAGTATGATGAKLFVTPAKLQTELGTAGADDAHTRRKEFTCDADTSTDCLHNFGSRFVQVDVYRTLTPFDKVEVEVKLTSTTTATVNFNTAPTIGEYTIIVVG